MKTDENQIQKENAKLILDHTYRIVISYMKKRVGWQTFTLSAPANIEEQKFDILIHDT